MFLCELSMTLCLVYKTKSSDTIRDAIKINYPIVCYAGILLISVQRQANILSLHLSFWRQTQTRRACQKANAHLFTVFSVDKIAAVILTRHNTHIQCDHVKPLSDWTPVGGAYDEKVTIRQSLDLEAVFMQMFVPGWRHLASQIQTELCLELV